MNQSTKEKIAFILAIVGALACSAFGQTKPSLPVVLLTNTYTDSLIRVYALLEGTGATTADHSVFGSTGTIAGAAWSSDAEGSLLSFTPIDAPDFVIDSSETGLSKIGDEITVITKFQYNSLLQGRSVVSRNVTTGTTNTYDWLVYLQGAINRPDLCFDTDAITPTCFGNTTTMTLSNGTWYVFAGTYSNSDDSVKLYLDGVRTHSALAASGGGTIVNNAGRKFMLGRFGAAKTAVIGMHYTYVWNRRLSDSEISDLYSEPYSLLFGEVPEMDVKGNNTSIADGDATPSASDSTDFGSVGPLSSRSVTYKIFNVGSDTLFLTDSPEVTIGGTHSADFTLSTAPSDTILAGDSTSFVITFDPSAPGTRSATLSIANDDADENPYNWSIQGTGTISEIDVKGNNTSITDGDATPSADDSTYFGVVSAGGSNSVTYKIFNTGTDTLFLTGSPLVAIGGMNPSDFSLSTAPGDTILADDSTSFVITFTPSNVNPSALNFRTAELSISNNDESENPYNFTIQGDITATDLPYSFNGFRHGYQRAQAKLPNKGISFTP